MAVKPGHLLQHLAPLQLAEDAAERPAQMTGIDLVADGAHLAVTGNVGHLVNTVQAGGILPPLLLEGQQGGVLEGKHGKPAGQGIHQRNGGVRRAMVGDFAKIFPQGCEQGVEVQVFTPGEFGLTTVGQ